MSRVDVARVGSYVSLEVGGDFAELSPAQARALAAQLLAAAGEATGGPFECETARKIESANLSDWHSPGGTHMYAPDRCR